MANGTQLFLDNCQRANENPLSDGGAWGAATGFAACQLLSDLIQPSALSTNCVSIVSGQSWKADQYIEITLNHALANTEFVWCILRCDGTNQNLYYFQMNGGTITIHKIVAGTNTNLATTVITVSAGDVFRFSVYGNLLIAYQNYVPISGGFTYDSSLTSGTPGILLESSAALTNAALSSVSAGFPQGNQCGIWTKQGQVFPPTVSDVGGGSLFSGISNECVRYLPNPVLISANPDGNVFKMWFMGGNNIYYAESNTGVPGSWTRQASAVFTNKGIPRVYFDGTTYHLYVNPTATGWGQIDHYTSPDGVTVTLANAAIISEGTTGQFDAAAVNYFSIVANISGTYYALYSGQNASSAYGVGLATATNLGGPWTKSASNPVLTKIGPPDGMFLEGGVYYGWISYQNLPGEMSSIIARLSTTDFINWTTPKVVSLQRDTVAEGLNSTGGAINIPSVVEASGQTHMFYTSTINDSAGRYLVSSALAPVPIATLVKGQEYFINQSQVATDNFTRANGGLGANWTTVTGRTAPQIVSNLVEPFALSSTSAAYNNTVTPSGSQYSIITNAVLSTTGSVIEPIVMVSSTQDSYYDFAVVGANGTANTSLLQKFVAGAATTIVSVAITPAVNDLYELSYSGGYLSAYQNGNLVMQAPDSTLTSGSPGIIVFCSSGSTANAAINAWSGGVVNSLSGSGVGSLMMLGCGT